MTRVTVIWQRFGPYHRARLQGLQHTFPGASGIEVAAEDHYEWKVEQPSDDLEIKTLSRERPYNSLGRREIHRLTEAALDEIDPDVVAINGWSATEALAALAWCKRRGRLRILMSESHTRSTNPIKELVKKWRARQFDGALVGGQWHAAYATQLGVDSSRIEIGYDSVDNIHFSKRATSPAEIDAPYLMVNTRFLPRKNVDGILRAFRAARHKDHSTRLVICGSGEMKSKWEALSRTLNIEESTTWLGFVQYSRLPGLYQNAKAFIHIPHSEAWGLVINEAAAAGCPIIASTQTGATCELVRDNFNGWLVDSMNTDEICRAIQEALLMSESEQAVLGKNSQEIVEPLGAHHFGRHVKSLLSKIGAY